MKNNNWTPKKKRTTSETFARIDRRPWTACVCFDKGGFMYCKRKAKDTSKCFCNEITRSSTQLTWRKQVIPHIPYTSDIPPSEFHLCVTNSFNNEDSLRLRIDDFISKTIDIYTRGTEKLTLLWDCHREWRRIYFCLIFVYYSLQIKSFMTVKNAINFCTNTIIYECIVDWHLY